MIVSSGKVVIDLSTEIICALISAASVLLSALVAHLTARHTAKKELDKMILSWDREDTISADTAFSEMIQAVRTYTSCENEFLKYDALNKVDSVRIKESESINAVLVQLHNALEQGNRYLSTQLLNKAVEEKNKEKDKMAAQHRR